MLQSTTDSGAQTVELQGWSSVNHALVGLLLVSGWLSNTVIGSRDMGMAGMAGMVMLRLATHWRGMFCLLVLPVKYYRYYLIILLLRYY